jgi:hypothetical protein
MERTKLGLSKDKMYKALGEGERTSKKVASIRMSDGSTFKRKNANQYGTAEGGNDYTEKRSNRTDRFDLGGTADSSNSGANMGGTMGSSIMKHGGGVEANESMFNKGEVIFYFKGKKANDFYKGLSNLMPDHEITMVNDDKVQAFFGNYSDLEDAMQMAKTYGMTYQGKYKKGGNLIGKQKNLDLNKNGKLDSEDFKMIRGNKKANGGGLSDLPENPNNDAISYKRGGHVSKGELVWKKLSSSDKMNFLIKHFKTQITDRSKEDIVNKTYNFLPKNVKIKMESEYANVEEYAQGGLANTPESFPSNDAMSYKTGGGVGSLAKEIEVVAISQSGTRGYYIYDTMTNRRAISSYGSYEFDDSEIEEIVGEKNMNAFYEGQDKFKPKKKLNFDIYANGGSTKGFEYTIGGL